jgi:hypothetical protein
MFIRTRSKGSEFIDDLHHFTDKWQEVEPGRVRGTYLEHPNLEVVEDKKHAKATAVEADPPEVAAPVMAPDSDGT